MSKFEELGILKQQAVDRGVDQLLGELKGSLARDYDAVKKDSLGLFEGGVRIPRTATTAQTKNLEVMIEAARETIAQNPEVVKKLYDEYARENYGTPSQVSGEPRIRTMEDLDKRTREIGTPSQVNGEPRIRTMEELDKRTRELLEPGLKSTVADKLTNGMALEPEDFPNPHNGLSIKPMVNLDGDQSDKTAKIPPEFQKALDDFVKAKGETSPTTFPNSIGNVRDDRNLRDDIFRR